MKAVVIREHGGPEVLRLEEMPDPVAGPGEVLVRVRACALNHLDLWTRRGLPGRTIPFPHVLGNDIAGEVAALGSPVEGIAPGQRVMLSPGTSCGRCRECLGGEDSSCRQYRILGYQVHGGYAELVRCPAANVIPLPDAIAFEDAAAFPLVFLTAWRMLVTRARVRPLRRRAGLGRGQRRRAGGDPAREGVRRPGDRHRGERHEAREGAALGADVVINHHTSDVVAEVRRATAKKGVEVVVEHVGQATWERSILCLAQRGRLVTCGATSGPAASTELRYLFSKQLTLLGSYMGSKGELLDAARLFYAGAVRPVVHEVLPLAEARRAHETMERSEHFGKIVLRV